jgi:hypothetical protein
MVDISYFIQIFFEITGFWILTFTMFWDNIKDIVPTNR